MKLLLAEEEVAAALHERLKEINIPEKPSGTFTYTVGVPVSDRTADETIEEMKEAAAKYMMAKGAKGLTALLNLPRSDVIWGFTPDYMHCVLLGAARQFTELWLSNPGEECYIGDIALTEVLEKEHRSLKLPQCFSQTTAFTHITVRGQICGTAANQPCNATQIFSSFNMSYLAESTSETSQGNCTYLVLQSQEIDNGQANFSLLTRPEDGTQV
ncbi:hypothetical protein V5799_009915 [Amblyomma americanum]|uniref:Uncharacterized protein n=1 Tax=Amblyomma americanum TaxID=6943 RepID=A0AAQ4F913_AMBAM